MAMTHDYMDYLNDKVGIAPANSQEELQVAQTIAALMGQHDVEPKVEEFDTPFLSAIGPSVLSVLMLLGIVLCGIGVLPLTIVGFLLAIIPAALVLMHILGRDVSLSFGPKARSQNVVAVHRATGPLVAKGNRSIVVVAHYDSPHENFLYSSPLAPYLALISKAARFCSLGVALCALVQILGFLPSSVRLFFWVIGIVAACPSVLLATGAISERLTPCTLGANDNKSSVASLLGVLENVRPSGLVPLARPAAPALLEGEGASEASSDAGQDADIDEAAEALEQSVPSPVAERVVGVRHGEKVLRSLGVLPEDCEIEYMSSSAPGALAPSVSEDASGRTSPLDASSATPAGETSDLEATREQALPARRFSLTMDGEDARSVGPQDSSGLLNVGETYDADATQPAEPVRPDAPTDPEWGKTSYRPQPTSVARRASLFDLPDPSETGVDPFGTDPNATRVQSLSSAPAPVQAVAPQAVPTTATEHKERPSERARRFFDRFKKKPATEKGDEGGDLLGVADDDPSDADKPHDWRGGAAPRSGLRLVEDEGAAPSEEELRDAVLSLGDDALVSHDIWFVALGASSLDHAGMRAFLDQHRSDVRGSFVVNLDCVGAGELAVLAHEGLETPRRADRRLARLLTNAAGALHIPLGQKSYDWNATDALPAMRSSMRSVTLMGLGENGLPALSRTAQDVPENVSGDQAAAVTEIVTEMIRRS